MKKILIVSLLMAVALAASPVMAAESNTLMIFSFRPGGSLGFTGSFNASGVLHEAASADSSVQFNPVISNILVADKVIHLKDGDVYMTVQGPLNTTNFPSVSLTGTWKFNGGTGSYSRISGSGTCAVVGDFGAGTFSGAYHGKVRLAGGLDDED
jgi:hypothetical protein